MSTRTLALHFPLGSKQVIAAGLLVLGLIYSANAQEPIADPPSAAVATAFVNVNLIRMDGERVEAGRTVIVRGDRIVAIGTEGEVSMPEGATVIDGTGRYLVPGLTDAHVHLTTDMPWAPTRPDFGDAPLYLAYGVTTVVNLRGTPTQLEWRRRIETGELLGPTIYTSGDFVNEPRVRTPDEVQQDIVAQSRQGYDLIKFHELDGTSSGLSLQAYLKMNETARALGLPLVGHAPVNLGLGALLQARQPLAHMGTLSNIYFLPILGNLRLLLVTAVAFLALIVAVVTGGVRALIGRRQTIPQRRSTAMSRVRAFTGWITLAGLLAFLCEFSFKPGSPLFESLMLRQVFTGLAISIAALALVLVSLTVKVWRDPNATGLERGQAALVSIASVTLTYAIAIFWAPLAWRSTDSGIERFARRLHDAGIPVQTTLVVYETMRTETRLPFFQDPVINYLRPDTRDSWRQLPQTGLPYAHVGEFMRKVTAALHREGVTLIAGTDAMGMPLIAPGSSLHRELQLLTAAGLTPFEAIRAATVAPAVFLGKDKEFGTVATGKRADLLLVDGNPLEDVGRLKQPIGVMVRGTWLPRERLQRMLAALGPKG